MPVAAGRSPSRPARSTPRSSNNSFNSRPHPEQGYRSCLGLKDLLRVYGGERLEAACRRALPIGTLTYGSDGVDAPSRRHRDVPRWY